MDSTLLLRSTSPSELRPNKIRFNSNHLQASSTQCKGLNIQNIAALSQDTRISSPTIDDSQNTSAPRSLTSAPISQPTTSFQFFPESDTNPGWPLTVSSEESTGTTPLMTLGPHTYSENPSQLSNLNTVRSNISPAALHSVGITPYDPQFDIFGAWPHFEIQDQLFSSISSPCVLYEEPEVLKNSAFSRSPSSSPPHSRLGADQRGLKRQQELARRESKSCLRRARSASSNSNHYSISQRTSPDLLPKSDYASSVTPSPLLSQCSIQNSPALSSTSFLPSYTPQISGPIPSDIYGPTFTIPGDFTSAMSYPIPYTTQAEAPLPSFIDRPPNLTVSSTPENLGVYCPPMAGIRLGPTESNETVRVVHSRPKPQCWEHGCNGRQFSTFSNLLRHQREKSGAAQKSSCPHCGAEFTRTTARNGHLAHDKCKQRRST